MKRNFPVLQLLIWLCCFGATLPSQAQCPVAADFTSNVTLATCPSNGIIKLSNPNDVAVTGGMGLSGSLYQITSGPASGGYQTTAQSANEFDGLPLVTIPLRLPRAAVRM